MHPDQQRHSTRSDTVGFQVGGGLSACRRRRIIRPSVELKAGRPAGAPHSTGWPNEQISTRPARVSAMDLDGSRTGNGIAGKGIATTVVHLKRRAL
jgi:hypothetical protein